MDIHSFGLYRVASAVPTCTVGNCSENAQRIEACIKTCSEQGADLVVFPALAISSASCGDLFTQQALLEAAQTQVQVVVQRTAELPVITVLGFPVRYENRLYNAAAVFSRGTVYGIAALDSTPAPVFSHYDVPYTASVQWNGQADRIPFGTHLVFTVEQSRLTFGIGHADLFSDAPPALAIIPLATPSSPTLFDSLQQTYAVLSRQVQKNVIYVNAGWGESSAEGVYAAETGIIEKGEVLAAANGFQFAVDKQWLCYTACQGAAITLADIDCSGHLSSVGAAVPSEKCERISLPPLPPLEKPLMRPRNPLPFIPLAVQKDEQAKDIFFSRIIEMQAQGLAKRMRHTNNARMMVGISGGLDSTLALLIAHAAAGLLGYSSDTIIAVTMPGFGTTKRTKTNAIQLAALLGCTSYTIPIKKALLQHFTDIGHDPNVHSTVYENAQARERTQILMDKANQMNALLIGTGDLSESALGWETYNGDHMSMYGVNAGLPKSLLSYCISYYIKYPPLSIHENAALYRHVLHSILDTPISPELLPAEKEHITQKTEDILGPYELHDFFLYYLLHTDFSPKKIYFLAEQTFCTPPTQKYETSQVLACLQLFYHRFFSQQFKRSCMPDGLAVGLGSFSPRSAWHMPSDMCADLWLRELEALEVPGHTCTSAP
ncbi:MAG: NAD(+) synthase [Treponema sp.]